MSLIQERIPEQISSSLDPRYTTDYHPDSTYRWKFNLNTLDPLKAWVAGDVEKLFRSAQRWTAEAVSISLENTNKAEYPVPLLSINVVLHTKEAPPTKRELFIKPLTIRTQLDLRRILRDDIVGQDAEVQYHGSRRDLFINTDIPQLGPFGPEDDFEKAKTPYFIRRIGLHAFYYYNNSRETITGEDPSRVFLAVDLLDGRATTQNAVDSKLGEHNKKLITAQVTYLGYKSRYKSLLGVTAEELVEKERRLLQDLNARPDPFNEHKPLLQV